jgi:phenylpropionate dioxygenase-like ring-hydroxylating dioxygenase large terminal subunit
MESIGSLAWPRNAWYPALWSQDLKAGAMVARTFLGEPVVLFRDPGGVATALADVCPHRFAPLHRGELQPGGGIRCMYHGLEFSSDGRCTLNPHGDGALPRNCSVRGYPVAEKHSLVWIWLGERRPDASAIPDYSILDPQDGLVTHRDSITMAAGYRLLCDNLMDLSHAAFLHDGILNRREAAWAEIKLEQQGNTLRCSRWMPDIPIARLYDLLYKGDGKPVDHWNHMRWDPPACFLLDVGVHPPGGSRNEGFGIHATHLLTPQSEKSTHYLFAVTRKPDVSEDKVRKEVADLRRYAFEMQDKPMIEAQQKNIDYLESTGGMSPLLIASIDAGPVRMQRILDQLIADESVLRAKSA